MSKHLLPAGHTYVLSESIFCVVMRAPPCGVVVVGDTEGNHSSRIRANLARRMLQPTEPKGKTCFGPIPGNPQKQTTEATKCLTQTNPQKNLGKTLGNLPYGGWTKSCTTLKPSETLVCWYLQGNHKVSQVVRIGFQPSTVFLTCPDPHFASQRGSQPTEQTAKNHQNVQTNSERESQGKALGNLP